LIGGLKRNKNLRELGLQSNEIGNTLALEFIEVVKWSDCAVFLEGNSARTELMEGESLQCVSKVAAVQKIVTEKVKPVTPTILVQNSPAAARISPVPLGLDVPLPKLKVADPKPVFKGQFQSNDKKIIQINKDEDY
jgi:hypothetical protein